jgi:putative DNA primase/helicase
MWMIWDGKRWGLDETEEVILYAKQVVKALPAEYADTALHPQTKKRLERAWLDCESTGRLKSMVTNAASELPATHETFDPDPWLLNCENGTIDLRSGELLPHRPDRWQSKLCPVEYRPDAECPLWDEFLDTVLAHDDSLRLFLQRAVGLSLVGQVLEHVLFVLWGGGRNGKGVFLNTLLAILGDYAKPAATDLLTSTANPQHPTSVAELRGVRFVTNAEPQQKFNENLVKFLTGGDPRNARFLFQDAFTYIPSDTFWIHTNHKPVPQGGSEGFYRRVRLIPFTVTIPPGREDPRLTEKLRAEASGILAWAVHGCLAWQRDGLGTAAAVTAATDTYRLEMDTLAAFLSDCCVLDPDASVLVGDLHQAYTEWAKQAGEPAVSQRFLGLRLGERGFERVRNGKSRAWSWKGIGLVGANVQGSLD